MILYLIVSIDRLEVGGGSRLVRLYYDASPSPRSLVYTDTNKLPKVINK